MIAIAKLIHEFEQNLELGKFVEIIGVDNLFYQLRIHGFRSDAENALDAEGEASTYFSNTIGMLKNPERISVFDDLIHRFDLLGHEVHARYFTEGF